MIYKRRRIPFQNNRDWRELQFKRSSKKLFSEKKSNEGKNLELIGFIMGIAIASSSTPLLMVTNRRTKYLHFLSMVLMLITCKRLRQRSFLSSNSCKLIIVLQKLDSLFGQASLYVPKRILGGKRVFRRRKLS